MGGGDRAADWHPRRGAQAVVWYLRDELGVVYAIMQRLEDDAGGPDGFDVRTVEGRKLGIHMAGDAAVETAYADWVARREDAVDEVDEEPDQPY